MSKTIKFSDPRFFGTDFTQKYQQFKEQRLAELGRVNMMSIMSSIRAISDAERPHRGRLALLAIETAKSLFPVIDIAGLQFDVELRDEVSHKGISEEGTPEYPEPVPAMDDEMFCKAAKQKILNAFSQGAAVSMNTVHHMVPELDEINRTLKENYDKLMKGNEVAYLTIPEEQFAQMAMQSEGDENVGGTNRVEFREHVPYVVAHAQHFVTLIHEIIKGVYTYLALNAYNEEEEYHKVSKHTESIASEIEDIGCGKMILNMLREYLLDNFDKYYEHECFFEMYFVALCKLQPEDLISLMHGLLSGHPNKARFEVIARNCYYDLKDFEKQRSRY